MGVFERTREVGILRCLGDWARHIRRVFSVEAVVLAVVGWASGSCSAGLIYQGLLALIRHSATAAWPLTLAVCGAGYRLAVLRRSARRVLPGTARIAARVGCPGSGREGDCGSDHHGDGGGERKPIA
jgi:FtsX-like permease family protein